MQPDPQLIASALLLWATLVLLVPKRSWRTIGERLGTAARGERSYLFGPPARSGGLEPDYFERVLQLLRRELGRAIQLGLPVYAAAVAAETRGQTRRRLRASEWQASPSALLLEQLEGRLDKAEFRQRLHESRQLPVPEKLTWEPPQQVLMPPMQWRLEWEQQLSDGSAPESGDPPPGPAPAPILLEIRTMGGLQLLAGDQDLTSALLRRPVQSFIWLYLLVRETRTPGGRISRAALSDELFAGLDPDQQRERLRKRLSEMHTLVPEPLARCVRSEGEHVSIDLEGCGLDARRLLDLARESSAAGDLLPDGLLSEIERALPVGTEEFLPDWEEVERRATGGRGVAGDLVREVRESLAGAYLSLVSALAVAYGARRQPAKAIPHLEEAVRRRPEAEAVALKLAEAYEQTGQPRLAGRLRSERGLTEAS